jgi:hypothetical protein
LGSDQTTDVFFSPGEKKALHFLTVNYQNGKTVSIKSPKVDTVIDISRY